MKPRDILSLVAIMMIALIVFLIKRDKNMNFRLTKVENTLNDILINSDQTKLALGYMIQGQEAIPENVDSRNSIGFEYGNS